MYVEVIQFGVVTGDTHQVIALMNDMRKIHLANGAVEWQLLEDMNKSRGWMLLIGYPSRAVWKNAEAILESLPTYQQLIRDVAELMGGTPFAPYKQYFRTVESNIPK